MSSLGLRSVCRCLAVYGCAKSTWNIRKTKRATDNWGCCVSESVITHCSPDTVVMHFQASFMWTVASDQSHCKRHSRQFVQRQKMKQVRKNIQYWTMHNKMTTNSTKTKEIVFQRPCPLRYNLNACTDGVALVNHVKSLGVILQHGLSSDLRVTFTHVLGLTVFLRFES